MGSQLQIHVALADRSGSALEPTRARRERERELDELAALAAQIAAALLGSEASMESSGVAPALNRSAES
jgi:hypothetical protein